MYEVLCQAVKGGTNFDGQRFRQKRSAGFTLPYLIHGAVFGPLVVAPAQQPGAMAHVLACDDVIGADLGDEHRLIRQVTEPNS